MLEVCDIELLQLPKCTMWMEVGDKPLHVLCCSKCSELFRESSASSARSTCLRFLQTRRTATRDFLQTAKQLDFGIHHIKDVEHRLLDPVLSDAEIGRGCLQRVGEKTRRVSSPNCRTFPSALVAPMGPTLVRGRPLKIR